MTELPLEQTRIILWFFFWFKIHLQSWFMLSTSSFVLQYIRWPFQSLWSLWLLMSACGWFKSFAQNRANRDEREMWFASKKGIFMELLGRRTNVKPFISVFIWGLVTTVAQPLLSEHWALKTGGWWVARNLGWLLAAVSVGNSFCNLIIIAIFGAIKSSIFPLMAFTSCHIHASVLISTTD